MGEVVELLPWEVYEYSWGTAIKKRGHDKWAKLFLAPDGQEIDVEGLDIIVHDNGIEFI